MNRKQSHDRIGSLNYPVQKPAQQVSPYVDLLKSYPKNTKSFTSWGKPSSPSIASMFLNKSKTYKSTSSEKTKIATDMNDNRKRIRTQQTDQKMHESLFVYPTEKVQMKNPNKSLFYPDQKNNTQFQPNQYFPELTAHKNTKKRPFSQKKYNNTSIEGKSSHNIQIYANLLESIQIKDIDALIDLIDNCVSEANQYIAYLSQRMNILKQELIISKAHASQLQQTINNQNSEISKRDESIKQLEKRLADQKNNQKDYGFEMKNLLEIINKLSSQNERLYGVIEDSKPQQERKQFPAAVDQIQKSKDPRMEYYNEIHNKIDILNISIDSQTNPKPEARQKVSRDKNYKFIKLRNK